MLRRLILGAVAVLGVGPLAPTARAAELDMPAPKETESIVFVNVRQMIDSPLVKKYALGQVKQMMAGNDEVQKTLKDLGLDPLKDIDRVTLASWGKGPEDTQAVGVVKGTFDPVKLFDAAKKAADKDGDKVAIVNDGAVKLVKFTVENQPKPFYLTVADDNTIVAGNDKALVTKSLLAVREKAKPEIKKDLAKLLLKQDEKASMYAVALVDGSSITIPPNVNIPGVESEKLAKQLEKLKNFAMSLNLTDDVNLELNMGMADADGASAFGDTVSGLIGTVKGFIPLVTGQQPQLKPLTDEINKTLKSSVKGDVVQLSLKLSAEAIGKASGQGD